ncbi:MAG: hypothetical protein V3R24_10035 [Gemmatimonadales bacterium]
MRPERVVSLPSFCERLYRIILLLYPSDFRQSYGEEMALLFRERYVGTVARGGVLGLFWCRTAIDVACNAIPLHLESLVRGHRHMGVGAAAGGGTVAATVGSACLCASHVFAGLFGVAGAGIATVIWIYRPYLLIVSLAMLALAFLVVHTSAGSVEDDAKMGTRWMGQALVWSGTIIWVLALYAPRLVGLIHHH